MVGIFFDVTNVSEDFCDRRKLLRFHMKVGVFVQKKMESETLKQTHQWRDNLLCKNDESSKASEQTLLKSVFKIRLRLITQNYADL